MKEKSFFILAGALFCSCAGPHTPLGAIWTVRPVTAAPPSALYEEARISQPGHAAPNDLTPEIRVTPNHQVLHGPSPVRVRIYDPNSDLQNYQLTVHYNGFDVTKGFLRQSSLQRLWNERSVVIDNPIVRLPASSEHSIEFLYRNSTGTTAYAKLDMPQCSVFGHQAAQNTGDFSPTPQLVALIDKISKSGNLNPAFMTGLIAQESRFNPNIVSWAKAVGLTQITSNAEQEVANLFPTWPRYAPIESMSPETLRLMILGNRVTSENEWRLDPKRSIQGGVTYTKMLLDRWSSPLQMGRIRQIYKDPDAQLTRLVLASYHSGFARVSTALDRYGSDWIKSPDLREARKYVNRIYSYCDHFAEAPTDNPDLKEEGTNHADAT